MATVRRRITVRHQLTLALSALGIVPVLLTAGLLATRMAATRRAQAMDRLRETALVVCRATDAYVNLHVAGVRDLAAGLEAIPAAPTPALDARMTRFHASFDGFLTVLAARADGRLVAADPARRLDSALAGAALPSVADRPYFATAMTTRGAYVSEAFRGRGFGRDPVVAIAVPVLDGAGRATGIVEGSLDLRRLGRFGDGFRMVDGTTFDIVDPRDRLIYASARADGEALAELRGDPLLAALARADSVPNAAALAAVDAGGGALGASCHTTLGWRVVMRRPLALMRRDMLGYYAVGLLVAAIFAALALVVARFLAARIGAPIALLARAVDGPVSRRTHDVVDRELVEAVRTSPSAPREVTALAARLVSMADRITDADAALRTTLLHREEAIAERTQALSEAYATLHERKMHLRIALDAARARGWTYDHHTGRTQLAPGTVEVPGFDHDAPFERAEFRARVHPDDHGVLDAAFAAAVTRPDGRYEATFRTFGRDGSVHWVRATGEITRDAHGSPRMMHGTVTDVTEAHEMEERLRASEARFRTVFEHAAFGVGVADADGRVVEVNEAFATIVGRDRASLLGVPSAALSPAEDAVVTRDAVRRLRAGEPRVVVEKRYVRPTGEVRTAMLGVAMITARNGDAQIIGMLQDITEQRRAELALRESEARVRGAVDASLDALFVLQPSRARAGDFTIVDCNACAATLLGMGRASLVGAHIGEVLPSLAADGALAAYQAVAATGVPRTLESEIHQPRVRAAWLKHQIVRVGDGVAVTLRDIGEEKRVEAALRSQVLLDELTGLYNRRGFTGSAEREWQRAVRDGRGAVLACIDLDAFKPINDTYGHAEGDRALRAVADVLRATFRGADVVGRLGGDEFAALVVPTGPLPRDEAAAAREVRELERVLRERLAHHLDAGNVAARVAGRPYDLSFSVGTACALRCGGDGAATSLSTLMVEADERLYDRKRQRGGTRAPVAV